MPTIQTAKSMNTLCVKRGIAPPPAVDFHYSITNSAPNCPLIRNITSCPNPSLHFSPKKEPEYAKK